MKEMFLRMTKKLPKEEQIKGLKTTRKILTFLIMSLTPVKIAKSSSLWMKMARKSIRSIFLTQRQMMTKRKRRKK